LIFTQPAQDVFHVNNRIIHHFTDGDGQSAERDGVERNAELVERQDRREQRKWDRRQGNERRAKMAKEQKQHHRHQHRAQ